MTNFSLWNVPNFESLVRLVQKRSVVDGNFRAASYCEHGAKALKARITAKSSSGGKSLFARMTTKRGKPIADIQHNGKRVRVGFALRYASLSTTKRPYVLSSPKKSRAGFPMQCVRSQ